MRLSSQKLSSEVEKEILAILFQVIADTTKDSEVEALLRGILSKAELLSVAKRIAVAKYLKDGLSYTEIKKRLKISSATVSQIQNELKKNPGFKIALNKITTEEWASTWEKRIKELFSR